MTDTNFLSFCEAKEIAIKRALAQWPKVPSGYKGTNVFLKCGKVVNERRVSVDSWVEYRRGREVVRLPWASFLSDEYFLPNGTYGGRILS